MVSLSNATPNPPVHGKSFSITAIGGSPDYTFRWYIGEEEARSVTQSNPVFTLDIPDDVQGKDLNIRVTDNNNDRDADSWLIS